jgi:hypothetical protein
VDHEPDLRGTRPGRRRPGNIANDLDDHVLVGATIQLAEDLEAFALTLAGRLSELGELPAAGDRVSERGRSSA